MTVVSHNVVVWKTLGKWSN